MKKLLSFFTIGGLIASSVTNTIACGSKTSEPLAWKQYVLPSLQEAQMNFPPVKINNLWYLSTFQGLYQSTDGVTWEQQNDTDSFGNAHLVSPILHYLNNDQKTYTYFTATKTKGLWTSPNGSDWTQVNASGTATNLPNNTNIEFPPVKLGNVYYLGTEGQGLWTSSDGQNWTQNTAIPQNANINYLPKKLKNNTFYVGTKNDGLWYSTPGVGWTQVNASGTATNLPNTANIYSHPNEIGTTYYVGTIGDGLWTSKDGIDWTQNKSIPATANIRWFPTKIGNIYYLGTETQGLWTSKDGLTWNRADAQGIPTTTKVYFHPVKINNIYFLGTWGSGLYQSTDGVHWSQNTKVPKAAQIYSYPDRIQNVYYLPTRGLGLWQAVV